MPDSFIFLLTLEMKKIAIQGVKGCFHEQAARLFYEEHGHIVPEIVECLTFDELYRSMDAGVADAAIMAIENTVKNQPELWYGVNFEGVLPKLHKLLEE